MKTFKPPIIYTGVFGYPSAATTSFTRVYLPGLGANHLMG
jgi:hypothetical protein